MKKIISLIISFALLVQSVAMASAEGTLILSNTTKISADAPNCYARVTDDEKNSGDYSLHFYTEGDWLEISQNYTKPLTAGKYTLSWYAKGTGRVWFYSNWGTEWAATHSVDSAVVQENGWTKYTKVLNIDGNGDKSFLFHGDGAVDQYIDNISLTDANGTDYIIDGGFEEVTVEEQVPSPEFDEYETIILGCTDFQNITSSDAGAQTVTGIIDAIEDDGLLSADAFFCCGDYANTYNETEANLNKLKETVIDFVPDADKHVYIQGNHDAEIGTQGLAQSGNNDPQSGEYGVFVINEDDYMWNNTDLDRIKNTAKNLADYLNEKLEDGFDKPIFVLSHLPLYKSLRTTKDGDAQHANQLFHVLNQAGEQGLNIVFMSGHDHSSGYESYLGGSAVYLAKGDSINIPQGSKTSFKAETLNFTYMNAGYVGYCNASADNTLTMTLFGIDEDTNTVDVFRYDRNGIHNLKAAGVLKSEEETAGEYEADTTVYTSPQNIELTEVNYEYEIKTLEDAVKPTPTPDVPTENIPDEDLTLSDTTKVNVENTDTCFAKITDDEKSVGRYSLHVKAAASDWIEVSQNLKSTATAGSKYIMTVVAKPVSGKIWFRVGWDDTAWLVSSQKELATDLGDGWYRYVKEITTTQDQTNFLFHNEGAAEIYIDEISLVKVGETENLLPDGGFEEVTVAGGEEPPVEPEEPDVPEGNLPDDYLTLSDKTTVNVENTATYFAKVTDNDKATGNYSLHLKAGTEDWIEVSQNLTETAVAGGIYILSATVKAISGKVWFRVGWDDTGWLLSTQTDLGVDLGNGWYRLAKEVTLTADQTKILFHNDGAAELYIDDIMLVPKDTETNLVPDGGFEDVTVYTPNPDDFETYELSNLTLKKGTETVDNIAGAGTYTVSVSAKNNKLTDGLSCELLVAVFDESGVMENLYSEKVDLEKTELGANSNTISETFEIAGDGYIVEAYLINNRQEIDIYSDVDGNDILKLWK